MNPHSHRHGFILNTRGLHPFLLAGIVLLAGAARGAEAQPQAAATVGPQYLLFQLFTYLCDGSQSFNKAALAKTVGEVIDSVEGGRGDGRNRLLGFAWCPLSLDQTDLELREIIREAFKAAQEKDGALQAVNQNRKPPWALAEGTNLDETFEGFSWEACLARIFNHGGTLANIFAWHEKEKSPCGRATNSKGALAAYRYFLAGETLSKTIRESDLTPAQTKARILLTRLPAYVGRGGVPGKVAPLADQLRQSASTGQSAQAEKIADEILALIDSKPGLIERTPSPQRPEERAPNQRSVIAYGGRDMDGRQQIFLADPDGTGKRRLTNRGSQNFFPAWSANGQRIAFTSDRGGTVQVWVMDADGGNAQPLTKDGVNVVPTWSPDGKRLAFASNRTGHLEIWVMDSDGARQEPLTTTPMAVSNNGASWSPDGRKIAFCSTRSGYYAIWVMDSDGANSRQITTRYGERYPDSNVPAWSPDGTKIAFWSGLEQRYGNIWVMDAGGRNRKQLTDQPPGINCDEPVWSPDGAKILFASNRPDSGGIGIWIMDAERTNQRILIPNTGDRGRPAWCRQPIVHASAQTSAQAAQPTDWPQFRGPGGLGHGDAKLPLTWSAEKNIVWKTELPGPGASSPITVGDRIFVTCYSGYAVDAQNPGNVADLKRHLLCVNRGDGRILWNNVVEAKMPEPPHKGSMQRHGYASSTPASDGERAYVFFGKSGVFAFDLDGRQVWQADVGSHTHEWGTGASPVVYRDLVIVDASIESESLVALDVRTGKEVWRADGIREAYDTPHFVEVAGGQTELVLAIRDWLLGFDPATGQRLWSCDVSNKHNNNPSAVAHNGVIYCIVSGPARSALAVRAGGRGDVTSSHVLWKTKKGSNVSSPVYHDGYLYFADDVLGIFYCLDAKTGEIAYEERRAPAAREIYASPVLADGKLYYVSRRNGTFVLSAKPKFELLAQNDLGDGSTFNASPALAGNRLLLRSDRFLYCIGEKQANDPG